MQDIVVGNKSLTDVAKPSEIVSLFLDDEDIAESVAKRKQAEEHGYSAPSVLATRTRSTFGDEIGLGLGAVGKDEDEDDFFSLARKPVNGEDEDYGEEMNGSGTATPKGGLAAKKSVKRKADGARKSSQIVMMRLKLIDFSAVANKNHKKKVKIAVGADGLPL